MNKTVSFIGIMICILAVCATTIFVANKCSKPPAPPGTVEVMVIDSIAVKTLAKQIGYLQNQLDAKPKVIYLPRTVRDTLTVTDTLRVYPVGSKSIHRDYPFATTSGKDSLSLKVNTSLYAYVYTDRHDNFFYEDSLSVWITDVNIHKHLPAPSKPGSILYLMGGVGVVRYPQNIAATNLYDVAPHLGIGYMHGVWGGYVIGAPNGASIGASLNLSQLWKRIVK